MPRATWEGEQEGEVRRQAVSLSLPLGASASGNMVGGGGVGEEGLAFLYQRVVS